MHDQLRGRSRSRTETSDAPGVGSGKTFTMAHVIARESARARHGSNKTLAAHPYSEFKELFLTMPCGIRELLRLLSA